MFTLRFTDEAYEACMSVLNGGLPVHGMWGWGADLVLTSDPSQTLEVEIIGMNQHDDEETVHLAVRLWDAEKSVGIGDELRYDWDEVKSLTVW